MQIKATKAVTNLPKPETVLSLSQQKAQQTLPFVVYFEFECYFKDKVHVLVAVSYSIVSDRETRLKMIKAKWSEDNMSASFVLSVIKTQSQ